MRRLALALLATAAFTQFASAADLPVKAYTKAPAMVAAGYDWTGFYVGLNAGYSRGRSNVDYSLFAPANTTLTPGGFIGGGQIGANWQTGQFVWGIEADVAARSGTSSSTFAFANGLDFTDFSSKQTWLGTVRGRLGVAQANWLFYVTGGAAFGGTDNSYTERRPTAAGATRTISSSTTKSGYALGGGIEYGMGAWSLGLEYLYVKLGDDTLSVGAQTLGGVAFPADSTTFTNRSQIFRAKVNFKFSS